MTAAASSAERAPLLQRRAARGGADATDGAPDAAAAAAVLKEAAPRSETDADAAVPRRSRIAAARLLQELHHSLGLLLVLTALCVAALTAPARLAHAALHAAASDGDGDETAEAARRVPLPRGHARGVALWTTVPAVAAPAAESGGESSSGADGAAASSAAAPLLLTSSSAAATIQIHARIFPPHDFSPAAVDAASAADADAAATEEEASPALRAALRAAATAGRVVLLLPPTGGSVLTWVWTDTVAALTAAGYWVRRITHA
jgi:hypothetical protein